MKRFKENGLEEETDMITPFREAMRKVAHKRKRNANADASSMRTQLQTRYKRSANAARLTPPSAAQTQRLLHTRSSNAGPNAVQRQRNPKRKRTEGRVVNAFWMRA